MENTAKEYVLLNFFIKQERLNPFMNGTGSSLYLRERYNKWKKEIETKIDKK